MHRSHGRYGHVTSRRGENQKHGNDRWTASPRHVPLFISQAGRERESTHALCLIFGRMGGRASQRRNQSIKSIWRLPYPPLNCPLRFVLLLSFCHRSGSTKTRTQDACQSHRAREHHLGHRRGKQASCFPILTECHAAHDDMLLSRAVNGHHSPHAAASQQIGEFCHISDHILLMDRRQSDKYSSNGLATVN